MKLGDAEALTPDESEVVADSNLLFRRILSIRKQLTFLVALAVVNAFFRSQTTIHQYRGLTDGFYSVLSSNIIDHQQEQLRPLVWQNCTAEQVQIIKHQLPADGCERHQNRPWNNRCSFSYATRCPDNKWLQEIYSTSNNNKLGGTTAVNVGCNKAMDAVNALRMLSGDPQFDLERWRSVLFHGKDPSEIEGGRCGQEHQAQFELSTRSNDTSSRRWQDDHAVVHCIEAMPVTFDELNRTAYALHWQDRLVVHNAALADNDGSVLFPNPQGKIGVENMGIENCIGKNAQACKKVPMYRLDKFAEQFVQQSPDGVIDFISIDVEGYDFDVLLGANETLKRTKYIEFEYNWKGNWKQYSLSAVIERLYRTWGLVCFWAGAQGNLWRITSADSSCFLDHYNLKFWSNVACVNPVLAPAMAIRMEGYFQGTLKRGQGIRYADQPTASTNGQILSK